MIIDLHKFEIAEKLPPGEDILKRSSNFSAIIDQAQVTLYDCILFISHSYYRLKLQTFGENTKPDANSSFESFTEPPMLSLICINISILIWKFTC